MPEFLTRKISKTQRGSASSKSTTEFAQPGLSRSNGSHTQQEGTNLGVCVCVPIWLVLPWCDATSLGVFDLCHFALLKRGCANSGGFGARWCVSKRMRYQNGKFFWFLKTRHFGTRLFWYPFGCLLIFQHQKSETGRIRFRGVRFQTPSSVRFSGLTEFRGANSVSSFQPIICVQTRTHRVSRRTHRVCRRTQWVLSSETVVSKQYSARFLKRGIKTNGVSKRQVFWALKTWRFGNLLFGTRLCVSWKCPKGTLQKGTLRIYLNFTLVSWIPRILLEFY